ncbi:MAG: alternative ribosome rescue aminoacyl-tRNA hydrolase ArfB [Sphingomonadaceae bacterium]|nr:alternative ribosome rescue aminoacyl-tRNA hydrolase ArfB [Sphingomonadaceae bacterium]
MIEVTPHISLDESELEFRSARASGPGGQHVNKSETAIELRFDVRRSPSLPNDVANRLMRLAGSRMTADGVLVIFAQSHRSGLANREDATERLVELIAKAAEKPKPRRKTKPTKASKERRLEGKSKRSGVKSGRGRVTFD